MRRLLTSTRARITLATTSLLLTLPPPALAAAGATGSTGTSATASGSFPFTVTPNLSGAPGQTGIQNGINVLASYVLDAVVAGFLISLAMWAIGRQIGNDYTASGAKSGAIICIAVAFLLGSSTAFLGWSYHLGG